MDVRIKEIFIQSKKAGAGRGGGLFSKFKTKLSKFGNRGRNFIKYFLVVVPAIAIFLIVAAAQKRQTLSTSADTHQASVSFQLASWDLPPQSTFGIWINSNSPVIYSDIELSFDPKLIKMTNEIVLKGGLTKNIKVTSMAEANTTGKVSVVSGADPALSAAPPSGVFQVADLTFNSNTSSQNVSTTITFVGSGIQIIALDHSVFNTTATGINLVINKSTPIPTAKPTTSPTPVPTPVPTPMPTVKPTITPAPTATPTLSSKYPPTGWQDGANCSSSWGWTCDQDNYNQALTVNFYADGPVGSGTYIGNTIANRFGQDLINANACGGTGSHRYIFNTPISVKDGKSHKIYAYPIDIPTGNTSLLPGTPITITCTVPTPTP